MASTWRRMAPSRAASRWHKSATASGAPLVASRCTSGSSLANTRVMARISPERAYSNSGSRPSCTCSVPSSHWWPKCWMAFSMGSNGSPGVASMANSVSRWNSSGRWLAPSGRKRCSGVASSATAMRLRVSVPVLSTASTVMAPSASTAVTRRVSTFWCAMRQAPSARNTVRMTGISSGRMAMARAMPESRLSSRGRPFHHQPSSTWAVASTTAPMPKLRTSRREPSCSAEGGSVVAARSAPMRPTAVRAPVAHTRATPTPRVTTVLANRPGVPSPPGARAASGWPLGAMGSLATGTASPVSRDSSTSSWPSISRASAAMRSPSCSTSRSPHTTSRPAMRCSWPSRMTRARGADRSRKDSSARWVLRSCASVMPMTTNTKPSRNRASPRSPRAR